VQQSLNTNYLFREIGRKCAIEYNHCLLKWDNTKKIAVFIRGNYAVNKNNAIIS